MGPTLNLQILVKEAATASPEALMFLLAIEDVQP